jgi:hypothetical protein
MPSLEINRGETLQDMSVLLRLAKCVASNTKKDI